MPASLLQRAFVFLRHTNTSFQQKSHDIFKEIYILWKLYVVQWQYECLASIHELRALDSTNKIWQFFIVVEHNLHFTVEENKTPSNIH